MTDVLTRDQRSRLMSRIRGKNTRPELLVRSLLHSSGYRFRLHRKDLPGRPDVVLPRHRAALFIHGCFWHGHGACTKGTSRPVTNAVFWSTKIESNITRDAESRRSLRNLGWRVLVIWECQLRDTPSVLRRIHLALHKDG